MSLPDRPPKPDSKPLSNYFRVRDLTVVHRSVAGLLPRQGHARTHSKQQIRQVVESIKKFGFLVPVLVDGNGTVIAGHARVEAAKVLEMDTVPTIMVTDLTDAEIKAFAIADNKLALNADWSMELLSEEFKFLSEASFDLSLTGFDYGEIEQVFEFAEGEKVSPLDNVLAPEGPVVSRLGDLWMLGTHRLVCDDARDPEVLERLMDGKKADMVFTDPPYNVKIDGHVCGKGAVKHREFAMAAGEMSEGEFTAFQRVIMQNLVAHSANGSIHYYCMDWRHMHETLEASKGVYTKLMNLCVWAKTNGGMGTFYRSRHELVFVFKNGTQAHINNFKLGQYGRNRTNVWDYRGVNVPTKEARADLELHPTVKPVALVADAIKDCSKRGNIVLDAFMGSGTTLIAAETTGRCAYGVELDPQYVDIIIRRWQQQTGEQAVREDGACFDDLAVRAKLEAANE